jgi:hypothetical protein
MLSRLPWDEELPRSWTAAMRPTPVMIPVNIRGFSQNARPAFAGCARTAPKGPPIGR